MVKFLKISPFSNLLFILAVLLFKSYWSSWWDFLVRIEMVGDIECKVAIFFSNRFTATETLIFFKYQLPSFENFTHNPLLL